MYLNLFLPTRKGPQEFRPWKRGNNTDIDISPIPTALES